MITINGNTISGNYTNGSISITTKGDNVYINGDLVHTTNDKNITVIIKGDAKEVRTTSGGINVYGNVSNGVISTSGDINVEKDILGNVSSVSGDVCADTIHGSVNTVSGDIRFHR